MTTVPPPPSLIPHAIRCCDGCGATCIDADDAMARAWHFLEISKRYRCPACARALAEANAKQA